MKSHSAETENVASRQLTFFLLSCLLILGFVLRMTAAVVVDRYVQQQGRSFLVEGDANGYWELAQKLADGEDYAIHQPPRYVLRVPGFPLLLAASIRVFGDSILAARLILATVGTVCCLFAFQLGRQLFNSKVGLLAAGFLTLHPLQIVSSVVILSETWFTFWMLLSLISLAFFYRQFQDSEGRTTEPRPLDQITSTEVGLRRKAIRTGILIGVTTLIRPGFLPWLGLAVLGILSCRSRSWKARATQAACLIFGCGILMMPWALRNQQVTGHLVLTSLWSGPSLYDGLNPAATGASDMTFFDQEQLMSKMSEYDMNQQYRQRAFDFAFQHPGQTLWLAVQKAGLYLAPIPNSLKDKSWAIQAVCVVFWLVPVLGVLLAMLALFRARFRVVAGSLSGSPGSDQSFRPWLSLALTCGPFLLFLLVHLVFVGSVRYRLPVEFPLSILAAAGWWFTLKRNQNESIGRVESNP